MLLKEGFVDFVPISFLCFKAWENNSMLNINFDWISKDSIKLSCRKVQIQHISILTFSNITQMCFELKRLQSQNVKLQQNNPTLKWDQTTFLFWLWEME